MHEARLQFFLHIVHGAIIEQIILLHRVGGAVVQLALMPPAIGVTP